MSYRKGDQAERRKHWANVKEPASSVAEALGENVSIDSASKLQQGIEVMKVDSNGQMAKRFLTITNDKTALFCTHEKLEKFLSKVGKSFSLSGAFSSMKTEVMALRGGTGGGATAANRHIDVADLVDVFDGLVGTHKLEKSRKESRLKGLFSDVDTRKEEIVTIVHHSNATLNVLVEDKLERTALVDCLRQMMLEYAEARRMVDNESLLLRHVWYDIDINKDNLISEKEFITILQRTNIEIKSPGRYYKQFLKEQHINQKGLKYNECMVLLQKIKAEYSYGEPDRSASEAIADDVWNRQFGTETQTITAKDFLEKFLHATQHETEKTLDDAQRIINTTNDMEVNREEDDFPAGHMSRYRFELYLRSEFNQAFDPKKQEQPSTPLDQPLAHYWINTSHNTYLLGDQIASTSSVEMYMRALRRGCKCLELDCWDGDSPEDTNGEVIPVVFHGHTLTSKIAFVEILHGVQNYLENHPDTYPIILSLENHCSHPFQSAMAKNMKDVFGSKLYVPPPGSATMDDLPSPESLRGMIVIKGKRPPTPDDAAPDEEADFDPYAEDAEADPSATEDTTGAMEPSDGPTTENPNNKKTGPPPKVVPELANLTLFHGTKFKSFEKSIQAPSSHMHSIGETKIPKLIKKQEANAKSWREYNRKHMTRTYPAGTRVDSSNYNPMLAWSAGSQLVALNFQTADAPLLLNDGRFREAGGCGYLLKPPSVMGSAPTAASYPINLTIRVINAFCLPKPEGHTSGEVIDPYVVVSCHDIKEGSGSNAKPSPGLEKRSSIRKIFKEGTNVFKDGANQMFKDGDVTYDAASEQHSTDVIQNNGFFPVFQTTMNFTVHSPECAMLLFDVKESDVGLDDKVAHSAIPFSCLRKGFRSIPLYDNHNTRSGPFGFALLFVEVSY